MSGNARRSRERNATRHSWDRVAGWYDGWVGDRGSAFHRAIAIPAVLQLLEPQPDENILDVGAGQGVLAPYIAERGASYTGVDASPRLIARARQRHGRYGRFYIGDALALHRVLDAERAFDAAVFLLSIQDMDPLEGVIAAAGKMLTASGRIVMLLTHPAFRPPRHSGWGYDESRKVTFRRIDAYLTRMRVPMKSLAGRRPTMAYHRPISDYVTALAKSGFAVDAMQELPDLPPDSRPKRGKSNPDIPLFLALRSVPSR